MSLTLQLTTKQEAQLRQQFRETTPPPNRKRWTFAECQRLETLGLLSSRYELLDGEIIVKMSQKPPHSIAIQIVFEWLVSIFGLQQARIQGPIGLLGALGKFNYAEPDVCLTKEMRSAYETKHPGPADILLLVEISDTTLSTDLNQKAVLYARAGIVEYWVLDIVGRKLYQRRNPKQGKYKTITTWEETNTVSCLARPEETVLISQLLPMPST